MHTATAKWNGEMGFDVVQPGGELHLEANEEMGGSGDGFRSKPLMLSALVGCTGMDVASMIHKMRLKLDGFDLSLDAKLRDEHPKIYTDVKVTFTFAGADLDETKLNRAVDLSVNKYCGVIAMFKAFANVETEVVFKNA